MDNTAIDGNDEIIDKTFRRCKVVRLNRRSDSREEVIVLLYVVIIRSTGSLCERVKRWSEQDATRCVDERCPAQINESLDSGIRLIDKRNGHKKRHPPNNTLADYAKLKEG